jgi:sialic acid synthase SpsE
MRIGDVDLSALRRPFLIAEAGSTHQGNPTRAVQMAQAGASSGADAVTFQEIDETALYADLPELPVPRQERVGWACLAECRDIVKAAGLSFSICVTDIASLQRALSLGIDFIKVVSYDVTFLPFLRACGQTGLPILMSTGASYFDEIEVAIHALNASDRLALYHTDCGYPTPDTDVNLERMLLLRERFGLPVGYCDHTNHGISCVAAAALGAAVIEKHFILDKTLGGTDHMVALQPEVLSQLFIDVKRVALMRGRGGDEVPISEAYRRVHLRRSLALAQDVQEGEAIREDMLTMLRPSGGLTWSDRTHVVGRIARKALTARHQLTIEDLV